MACGEKLIHDSNSPEPSMAQVISTVSRSWDVHRVGDFTLRRIVQIPSGKQTVCDIEHGHRNR